MEPFLKQVARYLYRYHREELSEFCLVFPGRRAGVFFTAYLNEIIDKPVLSPEIQTINELISFQTNLQLADPVSLILKLHEVYSRVTGYQESLDEFFFWGEILLADFDDIDKYLLNAGDLFRNISDLKELESQFDYLSEEQKKAIEEFWGNLEKVPSSLNKEKFIGIWVKLAAIYHGFKDELRGNQFGYSGMIYREVAEAVKNHQPLNFHAVKYVFIGFNALNECEKAIFKWLDKQSRAMFFWDYDDLYLKDSENEAGRFLRTNLVLFPAPKNFIPDGRVEADKRKVTLVSVPGNITQAQAVNLPQVLKNFQVENRFDNTAFVLADENLLIPVISSVGNNFSAINITMGYPFVNTPVYGFISQLVSLQKNTRKSSGYYYKPVISILNHQFVADQQAKEFVSEVHRKNKVYIRSSELVFNPFLKKIFTNHDQWTDLLDYFLDVLKELSVQFNPAMEEQAKLESEYVYQAYLAIQRLKDSILKLNVTDFPVKILFRLLDQCLRRISIPFEGEPLSGLQIMGLLETRCLDFENLVLFSANEGFLPRMAAGHSFVPYHLRKGFGLPTYEDRDAMYAYYFYRLIQRNSKTVIVFNSVTEGISSSERSRFLYQLMYDSDFETEEINLSFNFKGSVNQAIKVESNENFIQKLVLKYSQKNLSPSAINTYLDCKLKFYFKYIAEIRESDELKEEIDAVLFGNLFHQAIEHLYQPFENKTVELHQLRLLRADHRKIELAVMESLATIYYQVPVENIGDMVLSGQAMLIVSHIQEYINQMIDNDMHIAPFFLRSLEKEYYSYFTVLANNQAFNIRIGGIVDRIDRTADGLRIVDYKTGRNLKSDFKSWDQLVNRDLQDRRKEIFQLLIYSDILSKTENAEEIQPAIYKLDDFFQEVFNPDVIFNGTKLDFKQVKSEFEIVFSELLSEIFSVGNLYDQVQDVQKCSYCLYNKICRR